MTKDDDDLANTVSKLRRWAATKPAIKKLWIYGKRSRGIHKPGSDLDICVEIDELDSEAEKNAWYETWDQWREELKPLSPWPPHLEPLGTPKVAGYIAKCSKLIYEREPAAPSGYDA